MGSNDSPTPKPLPIPVIVGVTGHRNIDPDAIPAIRAAVRAGLRSMRQQFQDALHVMTALAEGADQLVADEAAALGIAIIAVIPMPLEIYRARLPASVRVNFDRHWEKAVLTLTLPSQSITGAPFNNDQLYQQLGAFLARRSHVLLALWEGPRHETAARAEPLPGGTADVIRMRINHHASQIERDSTLFVEHDNPLFGGSSSHLDAPRTEPVVCIATPRRPGTGAPATAHLPPPVGGCWLVLRYDTEPRGVTMTYNWQTVPTASRAIVILGRDVRGREMFKHFIQIRRLNRQIRAMIDPDLFVFEDQFRYLEIKGTPPAGEAVALSLKRMQAAVDTSAGRHQRTLIGQFSAARLRDLPALIWKAMKKKRGPNPKPSLLMLFALAIPVYVLFFESYSKLDLKWPMLAAYLITSSFGLYYYHFRLRKEETQDRWQDYRALAEALRVQLYWGLSAVPLAAADNYMRKHDGELGWIRFALQGPGIWAAALAMALPAPCRKTVESGWMQDQAVYFLGKDGQSGKSAQNHHAAERNKTWALRVYLLGLGTAAVLLAEKIANHLPVEGHLILAILHFIEHYEKQIDVFAVMMPAVAAFLTLSMNLRNYEAHHHNYRQMGTLFRRALDETKVIPLTSGSDAAFKTLVHELGREALAENAEWLMDHRDRRVEPGS